MKEVAYFSESLKFLEISLSITILLGTSKGNQPSKNKKQTKYKPIFYNKIVREMEQIYIKIILIGM